MKEEDLKCEGCGGTYETTVERKPADITFGHRPTKWIWRCSCGARKESVGFDIGDGAPASGIGMGKKYFAMTLHEPVVFLHVEREEDWGMVIILESRLKDYLKEHGLSSDEEEEVKE